MINFNTSLLKGYDTINVGVSMGLDSVVLSHFLAHSPKNLRMFNVNHMTPYGHDVISNFRRYGEWLRNRDFSTRNGKKVTYGVLSKWGVDSSNFKEKEFREYRYSLFDSQFEFSVEPEALVMCHHLDDAVESYLMNSFTGKKGLPIPEITKRRNYNVVRPFLKTTREELVKYAESHNLMKWVMEDPSNKDLTYRRNWIRLDLRPKIEGVYGSLNNVVSKLYVKENNEEEVCDEERYERDFKYEDRD